VSKYRSNSIVQLLLKVVEAVKPHRTEDDQINRVKDLFK
jgi:hypothetical protein